MAGIQKQKGREFGCETACGGEGRRGMPARIPHTPMCFFGRLESPPFQMPAIHANMHRTTVTTTIDNRGDTLI